MKSIIGYVKECLIGKTGKSKIPQNVPHAYPWRAFFHGERKVTAMADYWVISKGILTRQLQRLERLAEEYDSDLDRSLKIAEMMYKIGDVIHNKRAG